MTNRDLLKEAIADAKAVKETAIANAKAALEESFGPFLQQTLAAKLMEMEDMEEKLEEADALEEDSFTDAEKAPAGYDTKITANVEDWGEAGKKVDEEAKDEETLDLEALLRELDEMSTEESINEDQTINGTDADEIGNKDHANIVNMKETDEVDMTVDADSDGIPDEMDDDINIDEMSTEDLEAFIKEVIADMVKAGELEAGHEDMGGEEKDEKGEEGKEDEEVKIDLDELMKTEEKEAEMESMKKELEEAYTALKTIKAELQEVNLFNAKLLYTNKIFRAKNLTESQKVKVLAAFDKAASINEAKLVFETLSEGLNQQPKAPVNESLLRGAASKVAGVAPKKPILEVNDQFSRWQLLAGIKK
jgi:hypothetical protein